MDRGEELLTRIRLDHTGAPPDALDRMRSAVRASAPAPHRSRRTALVGAAAAGVAVAVVGAYALTGSPVTTAGTAAPTATAAVAPHDDAAVLLFRAANAADLTTVPVRDDQYLYTQEVVRNSDGTTTREQTWDSAVGRPGWLTVRDSTGRETDRGGPLPGNLALGPPGLTNPTYRYLSTLPTDPDALLALIRSHGPDRSGFRTIDRLLSQPVQPPGLASALYRAAAALPGLRVVPDAVDAAGRHGIAVAWRASRAPDQGNPVDRVEWIFDPATYELRGAVIGTAVDDVSYAILRRGVVDRIREVPPR